MARAQYACSFSLYDDSMISVVRACVCVTRGLVVCPRVKKCDRGKSRGQVTKVWLREMCRHTANARCVVWVGTGAEGVVQKMSCHVMSCHVMSSCVCVEAVRSRFGCGFKGYRKTSLQFFTSTPVYLSVLPPSSTPTTTTIVA